MEWRAAVRSLGAWAVVPFGQLRQLYELGFRSTSLVRHEFIEVVKALLRGKKPPIPDYPMCVECKLKENVCLFDKGGVCAGPVTRAGCGAICPTYADGCEGCRGPVTNPNRDSMQNVLAEHGLTAQDILARMTMFGAYQLQALQSQGK